MPAEVEVVGLAGYQEIEGQRVVINHIVPHVRQLRIEPCDEKEKSEAEEQMVPPVHQFNRRFGDAQNKLL